MTVEVAERRRYDYAYPSSENINPRPIRCDALATFRDLVAAEPDGADLIEALGIDELACSA